MGVPDLAYASLILLLLFLLALLLLLLVLLPPSCVHLPLLAVLTSAVAAALALQSNESISRVTGSSCNAGLLRTLTSRVR